MTSEVKELLIHFISHDSAFIFLIINKDGTIMESNAFADRLTGKQLTGMHYSEIFINFGNAYTISEYINHSEEKTMIHINTFSTVPETYYFNLYDLGSSVLAVGEVNSSDTHLLQENLLELNQEQNNLSRIIQKKNAEMEKLIEIKNSFLGMAAHDLRTPIGTIMGFSDILLEETNEKLSAIHKRMLNAIQSSSKFMLHLLNDLLDISKIDSGKLILEKHKVNIVKLIKKNIELNSVIAEKKNITIQFNPSESILEINIDPKKIKQVLNNFISNALKFSLPGTTITVKIIWAENNITVSIEDQGLGIPEDEMNKLFKPFETTSVKSTEGEKSTGLGLSIVRNIIRGHQGKVWVESKVGKGSTFYFSLPLTVDEPLKDKEIDTVQNQYK